MSLLYLKLRDEKMENESLVRKETLRFEYLVTVHK